MDILQHPSLVPPESTRVCSLGVTGEPFQDQVTVGRGTPVASQVSVRALCRGTRMLLVYPDPWMNFGGTGETEGMNICLQNSHQDSKRVKKKVTDVEPSLFPSCCLYRLRTQAQKAHQHQLKLMPLQVLQTG